MVSVCLPSDALSQHLPSYLGFSYLERGYLFTAAAAGTMAYICCADSMCQELRLGIQIGTICDRFIISIFCYFFFLEYICCALLCHFLLHSQASQPCVCIYPLFFGFHSHWGYRREPSRVPCTLQYVLISYLSLYIASIVYVCPSLSIHPATLPYPLVPMHLFSTSVSLFLLCKSDHLWHFSRFHIYALIYDFPFPGYFTLYNIF